MRYLRAQDIFPAELLIQIQKYADGEYIYIPKLDHNRKNWGENTAAKQQTRARNAAIYQDHLDGHNAQFLAEKYFLSLKSIQRILTQEKKRSMV